MPFPIKVCVLCGEEFELRPNKPGYANRCYECSTPEAEAERQEALNTTDRGLNEARRESMKNLLYRKDS